MLFYVYPDEFCGPLSVLTNEPSQFTYIAKEDSDVAYITEDHFME